MSTPKNRNVNEFESKIVHKDYIDYTRSTAKWYFYVNKYTRRVAAISDPQKQKRSSAHSIFAIYRIISIEFKNGNFYCITDYDYCYVLSDSTRNYRGNHVIPTTIEELEYLLKIVNVSFVKY